MRRSHLFLALFVPGLCFFLQEGFAQPPEFKVTAGDGAALDNFGNSVSISGDYAVVGAWFDDDKGSASGSAYFFHRIGSTWVQEAKVTAVDGAANDRFGKSVSISGDYAIIGAEGDDDTFPNEGAAYIFHRFGANWIQEEKLTATDGAGSDVFGSSVSISGDYAIVGAWAADTPALGGTGAAYIFRRTGTTSWTEEAKLISVDGFGVPDQGPADAFGFSVSISGDAAIVGVTGDDDQGFNSGSAFIFRRNGTTWDREAKLSAGPDAGFFDQFGYSVSISGDQAIVGAHDNLGGPDPAGSAYIFGFDGANWPREVRLTGDGAPDDGFGQSVGMTLNRAIVGAFRDENPGDVGEDFGSAYIYKFVSSWVQEYKVTASDREPDDEFGISVAIGNRDAIVGAHLDDDKGSRSGSAYFYNVNLSPVAAVAPPFTFECAGPTGTAVTLDGTGSFDPDGDPFTFFWSAPGITFDDPTSQTPTGTFPLGTTTVTLTLTDVFGLGSTNTFDLTVEDTIPPVFTSVPADVTVECSAQGGQTVDLGGLATATDI